MTESDQGNFDIDKVYWKSPDENYGLIYADLYHFENSALLTGKCYLELDGIKLYLGEAFSWPPIWSEDSKYFAVPRWITSFQRGYLQKLYVMNVRERKIWQSMQEYRVLNLKYFKGQVISGIDSPNYRPREVVVSLEDVTFDGFRVIKWEDY